MGPSGRNMALLYRRLWYNSSLTPRNFKGIPTNESLGLFLSWKLMLHYSRYKHEHIAHGKSRDCKPISSRNIISTKWDQVVCDWLELLSCRQERDTLHEKKRECPGERCHWYLLDWWHPNDPIQTTMWLHDQLIFLQHMPATSPTATRINCLDWISCERKRIWKSTFWFFAPLVLFSAQLWLFHGIQIGH